MINPLQVRQFIANHYDVEELRTLCFDLDIEYENLSGDTREAKARELLLRMGQRRELDRLLKTLQRTRSKGFAEQALSADDEAVAALYASLPDFEAETQTQERKLLERIDRRILAGVLFLALLIVAAPFVANRVATPSAPGPLPPMTGDFNIAVAQFGGGSELSERVFNTLEPAVRELQGAGFLIGLRSPDETGSVPGVDCDDPEGEAQAAADRHGADLLIYGNLAFDGAVTRLEPCFFLARAKLADAQELHGPQVFGTPIQVAGDVQGNAVASRDMRALVTARADALAKFVIGLSYYALDRFAEAAEFFDGAAEIAATGPGQPADELVTPVIRLFQGSAAAQMGDLPSALSHYRTALELEKQFARAKVGEAQILFLQGRDGCQPGQTDSDLIQGAIDGYQEALRVKSSEYANIEAKVALGLGNAYLCLSQAGAGDFWEDAEEEFTRVVANFDEDAALQGLAGDAYAGLGLLALPFVGDPAPDAAYRRALKAYEQAAALSPHADRRAMAQLSVARLHVLVGECDLAQEALTQAAETLKDFSNTSGTERDEIEAFRQVVQTLWQATCVQG